jgi:uncharacterized membrane protein
MDEPRARLPFLDGVRGVALVLMVVNHTARYWLDDSIGPGRWPLVYLTTTLAAPLFLFLVGFCLPLSFARARRPLAKYLGRAAGLLVAGWGVNLVVFPEQPPLGSNVLHTIAVAILVSLPLLPLLDSAAARVVLVAAGAGAYLAFARAYPALVAWTGGHPRAAEIWFYDFPPWPWLGLVVVGLASGRTMLARPDRRARRRYFAALAAVGVAGVGLSLALDLWLAPRGPLVFTRDFIVTNHWVPRGATVAWVLGAVFCWVAALYALMEVGGARLRWLVLLGRTALMLYVVHLLLVVSLGQRAVGITLRRWPDFWLANAVLVAVLVGLSAAWLRVRPALRRRRGASAEAVPHDAHRLSA